jgi:hypothetical protein
MLIRLSLSKLQFFTWDCLHPTLSWWKHFELEIPTLAKMGFTQVWLPPPNKGMDAVRQSYSRHYGAPVSTYAEWQRLRCIRSGALNHSLLSLRSLTLQ